MNPNTDTSLPADNILNDLQNALSKCTPVQLDEVERALSPARAAPDDMTAESRIKLITLKAMLVPSFFYKAVDALSAQGVFPDETPVGPGDRQFTAYEELEALLLRKCTLDQIAEIEGRLGLTADVEDDQTDRAGIILDRCRARGYNLAVVIGRMEAFRYKPEDAGLPPCDNPIDDFTSAALKATPDQIRAVMTDCGIEYNHDNPSAADAPLGDLVKEILRVVTRSDAAFATACGALAKQGLRPTFREVRPLTQPYTLEDALAFAIGECTDDQFNEVEQRIGLDPSSPSDGNRVGRVLDAVNAHQYNFFVTVERISAYDIKPKVEAVDAAGDKPNVGVIIIG